MPKRFKGNWTICIIDMQKDEFIYIFEDRNFNTLHYKTLLGKKRIEYLLENENKNGIHRVSIIGQPELIECIPSGYTHVEYFMPEKDCNTARRVLNQLLSLIHLEKICIWMKKDQQEPYWLAYHPGLREVEVHMGNARSIPPTYINTICPTHRVQMVINMAHIISLGLNRNGSFWSRFLTQGLYDPRLFIHVVSWLIPEN